MPLQQPWRTTMPGTGSTRCSNWRGASDSSMASIALIQRCASECLHALWLQVQAATHARRVHHEACLRTLPGGACSKVPPITFDPCLGPKSASVCFSGRLRHVRVWKAAPQQAAEQAPTRAPTSVIPQATAALGSRLAIPLPIWNVPKCASLWNTLRLKGAPAGRR